MGRARGDPGPIVARSHGAELAGQTCRLPEKRRAGAFREQVSPAKEVIPVTRTGDLGKTSLAPWGKVSWP